MSGYHIHPVSFHVSSIGNSSFKGISLHFKNVNFQITHEHRESLESTYTNTQKKGKMEIKQGFNHSPLENKDTYVGTTQMERWTPKRDGGSTILQTYSLVTRISLLPRQRLSYIFFSKEEQFIYFNKFSDFQYNKSSMRM